MILLVAGHPETRDALVPLIAARGYRVTAIDCNDAAIPYLEFQKPSVVILDCGLQDSFALMERIRSEPRVRATPVVMFSADDENVREKALLKGADAYVPKGSLDWAELLTEIGRFAGRPTTAGSEQQERVQAMHELYFESRRPHSSQPDCVRINLLCFADID